jgi:hypothetical protein
MLSWAQEQRVNWIIEMMHVYGFINRGHIMRKFRVSEPQASGDIRMVLKLRPGLMEYSPSGKTYRLAKQEALSP